MVGIPIETILLGLVGLVAIWQLVVLAGAVADKKRRKNRRPDWER